MKTLIARVYNARTFPILLVNFMGILGYSVVIPILIFVVTEYGGNGFVYGIVGATYPFFQFLGAPRLGRLSDRIGRKSVLIITQLGSFMAWSLFLISFAVPRWVLWEQDTPLTGAYTLTLPLVFLLLARTIDGFTGGNISVANAYMADISTEETRSRNFGLIGASTSLGFIVGPAMSGVLAGGPLGEKLPLLVSAFMALFTAFIIYWQLKETVPSAWDPRKIPFRGFRQVFQVEQKDCRSGEPEQGGRLKRSEIMRINGIPALFAIYFLSFFSFSLYYVSMPVYASRILEWDAVKLGLFLAYFSTLMVLVQGPLLNFLNTRINRRNLVLFGAVTTATGFSLLTLGGVPSLYLGVSVMALGNGLMWPSFLGILGGKGDVKIQGSIQGHGASMGSIASMTGLLAGGILFELWKTNVFFISGAMYGLIYLIAYRFCKVESAGLRQKEEQEQSQGGH